MLQIDNAVSTKSFTFNVTFEPEATQEDVFENCGVKKLINMALGGYVAHKYVGYVSIGVNITAFGLNSRFFSAIPLSRFSLKMSRLFAYFGLKKMRSMRSAQRRVELRRLGNQLPVLGKANSVCEIVKLCEFCLF